MASGYDAVVVGSGPNGLAAAITLAEAGRSVVVLEAPDRPGGGLRTEELLEPGFRHDVCSTIMALPPQTPFFAPLHLDLVTPPSPLAHPFDDGTAVVLERSVEETARTLGAGGGGYRHVLGPVADRIRELLPMVMRPPSLPGHPLLLARFALLGLFSAATLGRRLFRGREARALLAGAAAHSLLALDEAGTGAMGLLMLASAHAGGWPVARGGSASVAEAMARRLGELGVEIRCDHRVTSIDDLPEHRAMLLDLVPKGVLEVSHGRFEGRYSDALRRYRHGPGAFKRDWTMDGPLPWRSADSGWAATGQLARTTEEISEAEHASPPRGHAARPCVPPPHPTSL